MSADHDKKKPARPGLSRREFLKASSVGALTPIASRNAPTSVSDAAVEVVGPGKVSVEILVNGDAVRLQLEPRVTLLDALRDHLDLTGAKRVCDRGECGACTVLLDGKSVYACSILAIDAQGKKIETIEGLTRSGELHAIQKAFIDNDALQCGFCAPGFVMATQRLLARDLNSSDEDLRQGLSGNFCRCGSYAGIHEAVRSHGNTSVAADSWLQCSSGPLTGKRISRVDAPLKVSGHAKYSYDVNRPGMLYGRILRCPHAKARIVSIDADAAAKMPGVAAVQIIQRAGTTVHWWNDEVLAVAAIDESTAEDALRAAVINYEVLPHSVSDREPAGGDSSAPLNKNDLYDLLTQQTPAAAIKKMIEHRGISFVAERDFFEELSGYGVDARVPEALRAARLVIDDSAGLAGYQSEEPFTQGDPEKAFQEADVVSEGEYGMAAIAHCCLEAHGCTVEWSAKDKLLVHMSTQNLSGIPAQMAIPLGVPQENIRVRQEHIGGGFGSKFSPDRWGIVAAQLSKKAGGKPVRMFLERDAELAAAGARPSSYARVKVSVQRDGTVTGWQSQSWGTAGPAGGGMPPIPYVFDIPHQQLEHTAIFTNMGPARPWRAPGHPQAALITMAALDDAAARLGMDPLEFVQKNLSLTGERQRTYREELGIAAELMEWKKKWRPRDGFSGTIATGLGLSLHTLSGHGNQSRCEMTVNSDGVVTIRMGTQDVGTGTRTAIAIVAADVFGIPMEKIRVQIGDTDHPRCDGSGGSSTIGGVAACVRDAAVQARDAVAHRAAPELNVNPADLEYGGGMVRGKHDSGKALTWDEACSLVGAVTVRGESGGTAGNSNSNGVGGVQMAEVEVDLETGVVRVKKMVAVQDCGLIVDRKTAESQVLGALIMGISYSLFEEKIMDERTGRMLNANMESYRLAGIADTPELIVHMMSGPGYDEQGVVGLGEAPVISPGAAISNAVANAIGVRVPTLPLTPDRVLTALASRANRHFTRMDAGRS